MVSDGCLLLCCVVLCCVALWCPSFSVRAEAAAALREAAKRLAAAEAKSTSLAEDVAALQQELHSRPTHAQHK
jgi:hypothetical protein